MIGSEKQINWALKIIAQKKEDALAVGISPEEWAKAEEIITNDGGARAWIDLRNTEPRHLIHVAAIADMPEIEAKSPAQAAYARAERVKSIATVEEWMPMPPYSDNPTEQAHRQAIHKAYVTATITEMGKETSARVWIDTPVLKMVEKVRPAAIEAAKKQVPAKQPEEKPAEPAKIITPEQVAARKEEVLAKIAETKGEISAMATSEMKDLVARTEYASPERAMELLEEAWSKMRRQAPKFFEGEPAPAPKQQPAAPVMPTGKKPQMLSAEEREAASKRLEKIFAEAKREGDKLRAEQAKIPLEEQKREARELYRNGVYSYDEYALAMEAIAKDEAAANPAPEPLPELKLPEGAYIAYQGATVGGEYWIVKDDRGNQASGESEREAIQNLITQRENQTELLKQTIAAQIEVLIRKAPSAEDAEEVMNRLEPAMEREEYAFVSAELEKAIANFPEAPAEEPSVGAAPELPTAVDLAQLPPEKAAEKIITATTEEIMAAIEAAVDATLGGRWGEPSPAQQAIRSQVIADYRALLEKGGSYVADSRGRSVFLPWLRDAEKEMANQLANIIDKARSIDEVEEGIRALVNRTDQWAETVARTETLSVANEANRRMYAAEGVEKVQIIAGKDERTCPICKQHHMRVYPIDKAPHLPLHPNCRCVYVPYISEGS